MPALEVAGLSAGYNGETVIGDISLSVMPGEICGIIGPNGAGKSTFLRGIIRLGVNVAGDARICGEEVTALTENRKARLVSYLPQSFDPNSRLTVAQTVLLGRHPYRRAWALDSSEDLEIAEMCMEETDTLALRSRVFATLSGGEKRLVMLASALAQQPRLLLLDEPGSSLDFRHQLNMWVLLRKLAGKGIAVLVSTHEIALAGRYLDSVLVLSGGQAKAFGRPAEVFTTGILSEVFDVHLHVSHQSETDSWVIVPEAGQ